MPVTDFLERGTLIARDEPCLVMGERQLSYREVSGIMNRAANALLAEGLGRGHHVAVLSDNDPVALACTMAIMRSGAAYIPMDFRNTEEENLRIVTFGECEALFYQRRFHEQVEVLRAQSPKLRLTVCIEERVSRESPGLSELIASFADSSPRVEIPLESTAWLQTGSGTSGDFRMTLISHRAYHAFVAQALAWLPDRGRQVMLVAAPITHAGGGFTYHVLAEGGKLVVLERPDPQAVLAAIEEHRVTKLVLPPTAIYRLLAQPNVRTVDTSSLRYLVYTAAPMAVEKLRQALDVFGPVLAQGYGLTECLGIANMRPEEHFEGGEVASDHRLSACGRPSLPFCRVAVMDDGGEPLPVGERGEICARGDQVMSGYYKDPDATGRAIVDGWLHTGDVGFMDDEGYLHIVDRKKDVIITGGFNVFPREVEDAVASLEAVEDCAVIGVPDPEWGEAVTAVVQLRSGRKVAAEEIIACCKERVGSVRAPKSVVFVDELPRSPRGKVLKRVLRDRYWEGRERRV